MRLFFAISLCTAALMLPGCVTWNIGQRMREAKVTYTGVDVSRPLGGCLYENTAELGFYYIQVPEVTYHERTPLVRMPLWEKGDEVRVADVKDTGNICWVKRHGLRGAAQGKLPAIQVLQGAPPQGLLLSRASDGTGPELCAKEMCPTDVSYDAGYDSAERFSVPFRYVVDPLLSVVSTALFVPGAAVVGSVYGIWTIFTTPVKKAAKAVLPNSAGNDDLPMPEPPVVMP